MAARRTRNTGVDTPIVADKLTAQKLYLQLDRDLNWLYESADLETRCMVYDILDEITRIAMEQSLSGMAPGSFRRIFDKFKRASSEITGRAQ